MLRTRGTNQANLQSVTHQFLQRCWVSGTAKGKSKIKDAMAKKRNKITTNKPDSSAQSRQDSAGNALYEQCLNAPTPVRFLKPKDRAREAERQKLGLESKERQREKEILKKGGRQAMGVPDEPVIMGTPGFDLISLGLVDVEKIPKYELNEEDAKRLAKEYSRVLMRKHRADQAVQSTLLRLKEEAIEALPENLKEAAFMPDSRAVPVNRFVTTLTPPIQGYIEKIKEAARRSSGKEKIR